jgi:NAD(P)H-hydrate repair Nnr-like enzyme with NAD(P)H-hydrate epimerase domain
MHIVTVAQMRELEARAKHEYGLTSSILMENAGRSAVEILAQHIRHQRTVADLEFVILVGPGNNGGDGLYHTGITWTMKGRRPVCTSASTDVRTVSNIWDRLEAGEPALIVAR